jgi:hypothetical protein
MVLVCDNLANGGSPAIGLLGWGHMMVGLLRLCCAAGACGLAAGLLLGVGGAVAAADPDSSVSATQGTDETTASTEHHSTRARETRRSNRATFRQRRAPLSRVANHGSSIAPGTRKPKDELSGIDTQNETKDNSDLGVVVRDPVAAVANDVTPGSDDAGALPSDLVAAVANDVTPGSDDAVAPPSDPVMPRTVVEALVPNLAGPVSNVSALVQEMLSPLVGAVMPLTQLPSDLYTFLVGIAGVQPVAAGVQAVGGDGVSPAAAASVASRLPLNPLLAGIPGAPLATAPGLPVTGETIGVTLMSAIGRASAAPPMAPPAPDAAYPIRAGSSLPRVLGGILLSVSLWALVAAALPGAGGLGLITLAGVRVGYRQAKAGVAVRTMSIVRFARQGPLGIVRSGSLVAVHSPTSRIVCPEASTADHLLNEVA